MRRVELGTIGLWSETKLEILRKYAAAYSQILSTRIAPSFTHIYIDAFAGAGEHVSRTTGDIVPGSPLQVLAVEPPFREYHFIDVEASKVERLRELVGARLDRDVFVYTGDCNTILVEHVLASVRGYRRALCLLDPYGLHLEWRVVEMAGKLGTVDLFLNFPTMDMNRNALLADPGAASAEGQKRMTRFWGDESWRAAAYRTQRTLFGEEEVKQTNEAVASAFRRRMHEVAGFAYVPDPIPMRNTNDALLYYLFFATRQPVAAKIVTDIFRKHAPRGP